MLMEVVVDVVIVVVVAVVTVVVAMVVMILVVVVVGVIAAVAADVVAVEAVGIGVVIVVVVIMVVIVVMVVMVVVKSDMVPGSVLFRFDRAVSSSFWGAPGLFLFCFFLLLGFCSFSSFAFSFSCLISFFTLL